MRSSCFTLLLLTVVAHRTAAGQQQPSSIPTELAIALLDHGESASGNRVPKLVVGQSPAGMPASLANIEGSRLVGGVEYPQSAIAVLSFTRPPAQVALALDNELTTRGWRPPPPPPNQQAGFTSNTYDYASEWGANVYCGDSGVVHLSYTPAPGGGTYVKIQHSRDIDRSICSPRRLMNEYVLRTLKFPPLHPPPGMMQRGGGSGSGGDDGFTSARLTGPLDITSIVAYYLKELDSAGWKTGKITATDDVGAAFLEVKDADGKEWKGAFSAARVSPFDISVEVRMMRLSVQ